MTVDRIEQIAICEDCGGGMRRVGSTFVCGPCNRTLDGEEGDPRLTACAIGGGIIRAGEPWLTMVTLGGRQAHVACIERENGIPRS